jgi:magnesium transporter
MDTSREDFQDDDRENIIDRIITETIFDDSSNLKATLEDASIHEIAHAIRYMESDEREKIIKLLTPEHAEDVLSVLGAIEDQADLDLVADLEEVELEEDESNENEKEEHEGIPQQIDNLEYEEHSWVHIVAPDEDEIRRVSDELEIPIDFLRSPLDIDERPRIEVEDENVLVILRTPHFEEDDDVEYTTLPLGIILAENMIITVCSKKNDVMQAIADGRSREGLSTVNKVKFILQMFSGATTVYMDYLKSINRKTSIAQNEVLKSMRNKELIKLLNYEKSLVYFITSLKSNELVLERLKRTELLDISDEDKDMLEDVIIENRQAIEMTNIYSYILSGMMDAFASIISNNLNVVMKVLTSLTVILTIPILIASIYGMNIELPLQHSPYAFPIIFGGSLILSLIGAVIFIKKNWL